MKTISSLKSVFTISITYASFIRRFFIGIIHLAKNGQWILFNSPLELTTNKENGSIINLGSNLSAIIVKFKRVDMSTNPLCLIQKPITRFALNGMGQVFYKIKSIYSSIQKGINVALLVCTSK